MKIIRQFAILVIFCFIGEILHKVIPLPVPSAIYGMVLMFCALQFKALPLSAVENVSDYLLGIMPLLFVPSTVGLIVAWPILQKYGVQFVIIGILSTMVVFFVTGHVTQLVIRIQKKFRRVVSTGSTTASFNSTTASFNSTTANSESASANLNSAEAKLDSTTTTVSGATTANDSQEEK